MRQDFWRWGPILLGRLVELGSKKTRHDYGDRIWFLQVWSPLGTFIFQSYNTFALWRLCWPLPPSEVRPDCVSGWASKTIDILENIDCVIPLLLQLFLPVPRNKTLYLRFTMWSNRQSVWAGFLFILSYPIIQDPTFYCSPLKQYH